MIPVHLDFAGVEVSEKIASYTNVPNSNWIETHQSRTRGVARRSQRPFGAAANQQKRRRSWGVIGPGPQALLALDILNLKCPDGEIGRRNGLVRLSTSRAIYYVNVVKFGERLTGNADANAEPSPVTGRCRD